MVVNHEGWRDKPIARAFVSVEREDPSKLKFTLKLSKQDMHSRTMSMSSQKPPAEENENSKGFIAWQLSANLTTLPSEPLCRPLTSCDSSPKPSCVHFRFPRVGSASKARGVVIELDQSDTALSSSLNQVVTVRGERQYQLKHKLEARNNAQLKRSTRTTR